MENGAAVPLPSAPWPGNVRTMSDSKRSSDPTQRFRELLNEWERGFDSLANRFMGTDEFSRTMNQFQNMQLGAQKAFAEVMAKQLAALNLPSREDVLRVGEAVHALENRLARLETRLGEIGDSMGAPPPRPRAGPPRTRRPPDSGSRQP
jgi:BMFP domain-containing protein YqiC